MLSNSGVKDGFKNVKYPKRKRTQKHTGFQHVDHAAGRTALLMACFFFEQVVGHTTKLLMTRKFKEAGFNKKRLFDDFVRRCPDYPEYYMEHTGTELTPHLLYMRVYHKCCYTNGPTGKGGRPAPSPEHYLNSKKLRPRVELVEAAFRSGRILSLEDMKELGK